MLVSVFYCKAVQMCSSCHCRCHCRSHMQCRYLNYKFKCPLNVFVDRCKCEWEEDERTNEDLFLSILNPHLSTDSLVLCGSWSGHKDEQVLLEAFGGKDVDLKSFHLKQQNMHNLWTCISSGNIKYMPRE